MRRTLHAVLLASLALSIAVSLAPGSGRAEEGWRGHREHERRERFQRWRYGDIRRFHDEDLARWRGGHWFRGDHFGRVGWWWIVDGVWYFYPTPIYPYPSPYVPPAVIVQAPPPPTPAPQYWYYCASVRAYYPYVTQCPEEWIQVVPQSVLPPQ